MPYQTLPLGMIGEITLKNLHNNETENNFDALFTYWN